MKTIHNIAQKFGMDSNGYAYFHNDNFLNNHNLPCYIPENAEDKHDIFSRDVEDWLSTEEALEYIVKAYDGVAPKIDDKFINDFVVEVYESLSWEFPNTYLDNLTM